MADRISSQLIAVHCGRGWTRVRDAISGRRRRRRDAHVPRPRPRPHSTLLLENARADLTALPRTKEYLKHRKFTRNGTGNQDIFQPAHLLPNTLDKLIHMILFNYFFIKWVLLKADVDNIWSSFVTPSNYSIYFFLYAIHLRYRRRLD